MLTDERLVELADELQPACKAAIAGFVTLLLRGHDGSVSEHLILKALVLLMLYAECEVAIEQWPKETSGRLSRLAELSVRLHDAKQN